ncbi:hypothetical protein D3H55_22805 [Bacillus salacetis]|uniref:Uncharacterized protein n=1 Tax=Bacillus salacetis TaxID=2315464 RepID=A0A3A1QLX8_9BACI|nr:hypothetical protein [Bacillus salacetis]RIW27622.1 hypothetical protein D3H55_22805 [Bacillus salacetis]
MLLYHPLRKTYDDLAFVFQYRFDGEHGTLIETDRELFAGQIVILKDISEYAIIVDKVWEENGEKYFSHKSAENVIVRARVPKK